MMKEQRPLVSFILTYYNQPVQMLCECINSILALSLNEDEREIIVVDDGSEVSPVKTGTRSAPPFCVAIRYTRTHLSPSG